ncbi:MAG: hypothetical protein JWO83_1330 [Caulobacteraceae bacterium]|jgi:hypothetical protein|nr:hypothetical protein [Caulobacteraceae bacterium]
MSVTPGSGGAVRAVGLLGHPSLEHAWYRRALVLEDSLALGQRRVASKPPPQASHLIGFIEAANRWLESGRARPLWVDHWEQVGTLHNTETFVLAARAGLGETRSLEEAPGHLFGSHAYGELDLLEIAEEQKRDVGILFGLASMMIIDGADGWLIAQGGSDRFEFWEGNVFFHSANASKLDAARKLCCEFDCELRKESRTLGTMASRLMRRRRR